MDKVTPEVRSKIMRKVHSKDTTPEKIVRSLAHRLGYRFRLHQKELPGKPDLTFPRMKKVVFVHGCFWHGHSCKAGQNRPKSNTEYWEKKLTRTQTRDSNNLKDLRGLEWQTIIIWECETKNIKLLTEKIKQFLG
ncbi:MAG: DNA mismatch endonuclease Vsr [Proteobacteria bacterium]|nr:DNA mismatch endonuclease Vsr [Pseudomonadota bacterium]MBU1640112.1 DNA mismatch endonuclease Vsr [Pseudomonadota bacterium]